MFRNLFKRDQPVPVDSQIDAVLEEMTRIGPADEKYSTMMKYLEQLTNVKKRNLPIPVSRDTVVLVLGNIASIVILVAYERTHVMTSKGFNLVNRPLK